MVACHPEWVIIINKIKPIQGVNEDSESENEIKPLYALRANIICMPFPSRFLFIYY